MSFGTPLLLWVTGAVAILLTTVFALDFTRRRRALERVGYAPMLLRMAASLSSRRRVLKVVLLVVAATGIGIALARPQVEGESVLRHRGIDVAVVMDFSKSMLARDVYPSRYQRMLEEAEALIDRLEADRVATIAFAGAAVHFPLTHDREAAKLLFRGLEPQDLAPGSDVTEAFRRARCILRPDVVDAGCERTGGRGESGSLWRLCGRADPGAPRPPPEPALADRARAIVIFSDGEDTESFARAEVEAAVALGIEVFIVGVGTVKGELIPEFDESGEEIGPKKAEDGSLVTTRLDQAALTELAKVAGGEDRYFRLHDGEVFRGEELLARLQRLKKGDLDERVVHKPIEVYPWFLFPVFLLLVIEACLGDRRRRPREGR